MPDKPMLEILTLQTSMLPSVNQKNRFTTRGGTPHMYTRREYKEAIAQMRQDVQVQVAATRWKTRETDRYLIQADLPFFLVEGANWTTDPRDLDNPWKPMQDVLAYRHRAFYNDRQVEQVLLTRRWTSDPRQMLATILIARTHQDHLQLFPVSSFFDQWAAPCFNVVRVL